MVFFFLSLVRNTQILRVKLDEISQTEVPCNKNPYSQNVPAEPPSRLVVIISSRVTTILTSKIIEFVFWFLNLYKWNYLSMYSFTSEFFWWWLIHLLEEIVIISFLSLYSIPFMNMQQFILLLTSRSGFFFQYEPIQVFLLWICSKVWFFRNTCAHFYWYRCRAELPGCRMYACSVLVDNVSFPVSSNHMKMWLYQFNLL